MAQNVDPIFTLTPKSIASVITAADTTTGIPVYSAGTEGGAVVSLGVCSFDAAEMNLVVSINTGSSVRVIGTVNVPALSGTDGTTAPVNIFTKANIPALQSDNTLILQTGYSLEVSALVTVTGNISVTGIAGDY